MTTLKVGEKIPQLSINNQDGVQRKAKDYKGQWSIIYFYPKDNTPGCTSQAKDFSQAKEKFDQEKTLIIGISPDSEKSHQNFILKHELSIELLSDPEKKVSQAFGVWQLKKMYGREYMGIVRSTFIIDPKGIIREKYEKVKVKNHIQKVYDRLLELKEETP